MGTVLKKTHFDYLPELNCNIFIQYVPHQFYHVAKSTYKICSKGEVARGQAVVIFITSYTVKCFQQNIIRYQLIICFR